MEKRISITEVDKVEILTLQDNYIDITAMDNNEIVTRAMPIADGEVKNSFLAEHGFCAVVKTTKGDKTRTMLFDFGFSEIGAAYNAKKLGVPMGDIEVMALSHGHSDHFGGFKEMVALIGKKDIKLVVHPGVFASPRYLKFGEEFKVYFPKLVREEIEEKGVKIIETEEPYPLLDGDVLFLGYVERKTDFEKGFPVAHYEENGTEK